MLGLLANYDCFFITGERALFVENVICGVNDLQRSLPPADASDQVEGDKSRVPSVDKN